MCPIPLQTTLLLNHRVIDKSYCFRDKSVRFLCSLHQRQVPEKQYENVIIELK